MSSAQGERPAERGPVQSLSWRARRLRAMSPGELLWRAGRAARDVADRMRFARGVPRGLVARLLDSGNSKVVCPGLWLTGMRPAAWAGAAAGAAERRWLERLRARAEPLRGHRLSFFDLKDRHLGEPIDWNRDHKSGRAAPSSFAAAIDYRDFALTGDCKFVWEPNRHQHLVVLGRAYRASGDVGFAQAAAGQLASWLEQCPFGRGMNWRSPLELAIRLINWVWTLELIGTAGVLERRLRERLLEAACLHVWEIARKYSQGSSANNHRIGEAAGVLVAASHLSGLRHAARYRARSREILCQEALRQTHPDGGSREQALGYHVFVLQLLLLAGLAARRSGQDFPPQYWQRLERMFAFLAALCEGGRNLPMFGDGDDGYVLDLDGDPHDVRPWLCVGATQFGRADWKLAAGDYAEAAYWLLGPQSRRAYDQLPAAEGRLASRAFPESGYYLLQSGRHGAGDRISVLFDCGELGFGALAAHGHADALSFTLRAFGVDVLVDPGTYDYFSYPRWRDYFRSTRAHNTLVVDGRDQSEMLGPFLWGVRANARCVAWQAGPGGGRVTGEHDGYTRLADPVLHRRTLKLDGRGRRLTLRDEIDARREHELALYFHLAETCRIGRAEGNLFTVDTGAGPVSIQLDRRLAVEALTGSVEPIGGWVSRGYHRKAPATTLVGRCRWRGPLALDCRIDIGRPRAAPGG